MSKADMKDISFWLKNVRKFSTGTKYGYHPLLDFPTICIQKYLREIDGADINDLASVTINGTEIGIGNFLRALRRDNIKSKQRLSAIGEHYNLNVYLKEKAIPSSRNIKNMISIMTDEIETDIALIKEQIEFTLLKAK